MFNNSPSLSLDPSGRELIEKIRNYLISPSTTWICTSILADMFLLTGTVSWNCLYYSKGLSRFVSATSPMNCKPGRAVLSIQRSFMPLFQNRRSLPVPLLCVQHRHDLRNPGKCISHQIRAPAVGKWSILLCVS